MRKTFVILFILLSSVALLAFAFLLISSPNTRLVLSRFNPTLSEPIPEPLPKAPATITPGTYSLESGTLSLQLENELETDYTYTGSAPLASGTFTLTQQAQNTWEGSGIFMVDMSALDITPPMTDKPLHNLLDEDFFDTKHYHDATLIISKISRQPDSNLFTLDGRLMLRGETHNFSIPTATLFIRDNVLAFEGDFTFNRTHWGILEASPTISDTKGNGTLNDTVTASLIAQFHLPNYNDK